MFEGGYEIIDDSTPGNDSRPICFYLTPLKMSYEAAKKRAEPYNKIVEELPEMQRETVHLVKQAVAEQRHVYVLVNNRAEGNAPLTVQALAERLRD